MILVNRIWLWLRDESAQGTVEYALLSTLVALAAITAVHSFAANVNHAFVMTGRIVTTAVSSCLSHHG